MPPCSASNQLLVVKGGIISITNAKYDCIEGRPSLKGLKRAHDSQILVVVSIMLCDNCDLASQTGGIYLDIRPQKSRSGCVASLGGHDVSLIINSAVNVIPAQTTTFQAGAACCRQSHISVHSTLEMRGTNHTNLHLVYNMRGVSNCGTCNSGLRRCQVLKAALQVTQNMHMANSEVSAIHDNHVIRWVYEKSIKTIIDNYRCLFRRFSL